MLQDATSRGVESVFCVDVVRKLVDGKASVLVLEKQGPSNNGEKIMSKKLAKS